MVTTAAIVVVSYTLVSRIHIQNTYYIRHSACYDKDAVCLVEYKLFSIQVLESGQMFSFSVHIIVNKGWVCWDNIISTVLSFIIYYYAFHVARPLPQHLHFRLTNRRTKILHHSLQIT